jgi:hypothetical protein
MPKQSNLRIIIFQYQRRIVGCIAIRQAGAPGSSATASWPPTSSRPSSRGFKETIARQLKSANAGIAEKSEQQINSFWQSR